METNKLPSRSSSPLLTNGTLSVFSQAKRSGGCDLPPIRLELAPPSSLGLTSSVSPINSPTTLVRALLIRREHVTGKMKRFYEEGDYIYLSEKGSDASSIMIAKDEKSRESSEISRCDADRDEDCDAVAMRCAEIEFVEDLVKIDVYLEQVKKQMKDSEFFFLVILLQNREAVREDCKEFEVD